MRFFACLAVVALLVGCDALTEPMPHWVVNRQPLDGCGDGIVEADSPEAEAAQMCMLEAFRARQGAELVTSGEMATGDPLTSYVRVHENGTIEMFHNLGDYPSAPGAWERFRCEELAPPRQDDPVPGTFTIGGCEMLPVP